MSETHEGQNATDASAKENLLARVARLNAEVAAAENESAALKDRLTTLRCVVKSMGWRKNDCEVENFREAHNCGIRDLLGIIDGQTELASKYVKGAR